MKIDIDKSRVYFRTDCYRPWIYHGYPVPVYGYLWYFQRGLMYHLVYHRNEDSDDPSYDQAAEDYEAHVCDEP